MEQPLYLDNKKNEIASITPENVRGLSLGKITEQFGTIGLYTRLLDSLEKSGFGDSELVQLSLQLGLALHANDERTNGHYTDHLMRVTLHLLEDFKIEDPNIIAAGPLHDVFEDHPRDLTLALTGEKTLELSKARLIGREVLTSLTNPEVVELIGTVTNPDVMPEDDKNIIYAQHTKDIVLKSPKGRVIKLADFEDNAAGNHATLGSKQQKLDEKYIDQYRIHMMGLFMPDSLITGQERQTALQLLSKGHARALGRLAATQLINQAG
ncbi:MAG: hypothetical protein WCK26_02375 [Candidatus Saccharibacteria bacterium]